MFDREDIESIVTHEHTPPPCPLRTASSQRKHHKQNSSRAFTPPVPPPHHIHARQITDLPEALILEVLTRVSERTGGLTFAIVSRAWGRLSSQAAVAMHVERRQRRVDFPGRLRHEYLAEADLPAQIRDFRGLRVLRFERRSVYELSRALLCALESCPMLEEVTIVQGATRRGCSFTRESLNGLFRALPRLKKLQLLDDNTERWRIPGSVSLLQKLQVLHVGGTRYSTECVDLPDTLPRLTTLTSLTAHLQCLPPWINTMTCLRELHLLSYQQESLPPYLSSLVSLSSLSVSGAFSVHTIPDEALHLPKLRLFSIEGAPHLWELPPSLGLSASRLQSLTIVGCLSLVELPPSLGKLTSLTRLKIDKCSGVLELPSSTRDLSSLTDLDLAFCRGLLNLPADLGKVTSLLRLRLHALDALHTLPPSTGNLRDLKDLSISSCHALEELPPNLANLTCLKVLSVCDCPRLMSLPTRLGHLQQLRVLRVKDTGVNRLPESTSSLQELEDLDINMHLMMYSPALESLPRLSDRCRQRLRGVPDGNVDAMEIASTTETGLSTTASTSTQPEVEMDDYDTERDEDMSEQDHDEPPSSQQWSHRLTRQGTK